MSHSAHETVVVLVVVVALLAMTVVVTLQGPMVAVVTAEAPETVVTLLEEGSSSVGGAATRGRPVARYSIRASEATFISSAERCWSQMETKLSAQSEYSTND